MPFGNETSGFWFHGRLGPAFLVPSFNVSDVRVCDGVHVEIAWEGIGLWSRPGHRQFKQIGEATSLFRTIVGAWATMSGTALAVTTEGWIEATGVEYDSSIMGWVINRPGAAAQAVSDSETSWRMRTACDLAVAVHDLPPYRLALRDLHNALGETEPDSLVFAYRALEDLARAVSGQKGNLTGADWRALHERLGQDPAEARAQIEPLRLARNALMHGNAGAAEADRGQARRDEFLLGVRQRVLQALATDPGLEHIDLPTARGAP